MKCADPTCQGLIEDGYCNICGLVASAHSAEEKTESDGNIESPKQIPSSTSSTVASLSVYRQSSLGEQRSQSVNIISADGWSKSPISRKNTGYQSEKIFQSCPQPGCLGHIVDGYCDLCGNPPLVVKADSASTVLGTEFILPMSSDQFPSFPLGTALLADAHSRFPLARSHRRSSILGEGITEVPQVDPLDPAQMVLSNPHVPPSRRICPNCSHKVGSTSDEMDGICSQCATHFDFRPAIAKGEIVARQYEVVGPIAYGGVGWIYLAKDRNLSDRWVVLKGLLNQNDDDAVEAVKSEGEFLASVEHRSIVEIYNFVEYCGARYIVMECVPGLSLTQMLNQRQRGGNLNPFPLDWVLAYAIEILPALSYLHEMGLVYCDFKPDNVMQVGDSLTLIDLGSVQKSGISAGPIFATVGYQAPELKDQGPSVLTDIYSVGRSLMVMASGSPTLLTDYDSVPPVSAVPAFSQCDSFYRLVQRCCAPYPQDRFQSADDLRIQARGVLREIAGCAIEGAAKLSAVSTLFTAPSSYTSTQSWTHLPQLRFDRDDQMAEWLASITLDDLLERLRALDAAPHRSPGIILAQIHLAIRTKDLSLATRYSDEILHIDPWDWRAVWMKGIIACAQGRWEEAVKAFNTVYSQLPGELAVKFALAFACEHDGRYQLAEQLYAICASTDAAYVTPSAFALARLRKQRGDRPGVLAALGMVSTTSRGYAEARFMRIQMSVKEASTCEELVDAYDAVKKSGYDPVTSAQMMIDILNRLIEQIRRERVVPKLILNGKEISERRLRSELESSYLTLARWSEDSEQKRLLMALADQQRRWSLI